MYLLYNQAGADLGPYSIDDLRTMFANGEIPHDKLVRQSHSKDWKTLSAILPEAIASATPQSSTHTGTAATPSNTLRRYRDAYLVASAAIAFAGAIKALGWLVAIVTWLAGIIFATQQNGGGAMAFIVAALIFGVIQLIVFHFFGVLVAAAGQILRAALDTAVHSSPFLDDQQKATAIGI